MLISLTGGLPPVNFSRELLMQDVTNPKRLQVMVVDPNPLMRFALLSVVNLHPLLQVCGEAGDARSARSLFLKECPRIVVLDIDLPKGDGIELVREFVQFESMCRYVVVSAISEPGIVQRAFDAGAQAYVSKNDEATELTVALETVITNGTFIGKLISQAIGFNITNTPPKRALKLLGNLSDREMHIFRRMGKGEGTTAISRELGISIKTVETHQAHIKKKLHLASSTQLHLAAESWVRIA